MADSPHLQTRAAHGESPRLDESVPMTQRSVGATMPKIAWPSSPHDPRERALLDRYGDWEVRACPDSDFRFFYVVERGLWHVQLWQAEARISVLTPSRITCGEYEASSVESSKRRVREFDELDAVLRHHFGVAPPSERVLGRALREFVEHFERHAWWFAAGPCHRMGRPRA